MKKQKIAVILSLIFLLGAFSACSAGGSENETASSSDVSGKSTNFDDTGNVDPTGIPDDVKFKGRTFRFLTSPTHR